MKSLGFSTLQRQAILFLALSFAALGLTWGDTVNCTSGNYADWIEADLIVGNIIDVHALAGGSCLGFGEYVAQITNHSTSRSYDIAFHAKYQCYDTTEEESCPSSGGVPGDGENEGTASVTLDPGESIRIGFLNDAEQWPLPSCCDATGEIIAVQCAEFTVTAIDPNPPGNPLDCTPVYTSGWFKSEDGGSGSCTFDPTNESTETSSSAIADVDADGLPCAPSSTTCCDNCTAEYNPSQTDVNENGVGDACEPGTCGDDTIDTGELCDGIDLGSPSATCESLYYEEYGVEDGNTSCLANCLGFVPDLCAVVGPFCGNSVIGTGEMCDGTNLGGKTCEDLGFGGGTLACGYCIFDTSTCHY